MPNHQPNRFVISVCALVLSLVLSGEAYSQQGTAPWIGDSLAGAPCIGDAQGYGPYDYTLREQFRPNLDIVEGAHFTSQVENLISGNRGTLEGDLDYTLRAWPNHHRALNSIIGLQLQKGSARRPGRYPPAECYLQRAIYFSPKDATTRMLYGMFLARVSHYEEALSSYQESIRLDPNNLQAKYNLGLLFVNMGRYEDAQRVALEVYSMKYPLPGLKRKLKEKGYWQD